MNTEAGCQTQTPYLPSSTDGLTLGYQITWLSWNSGHLALISGDFSNHWMAIFSPQ